MPGEYLSPQYFLVRITESLGGQEYAFQEARLADGIYSDLVGGRYGNSLNPGVAPDDLTFEVGDCALCRSAAGEGGLRWELSHAGGICGTTTTAGLCLGDCGWDWNPSTKLWERTDSTCDPDCACLAPTFCPDESMECATTRTNCARIDEDQPSPNCTGTTTTPSPDCTEGCTDSCVWVAVHGGSIDGFQGIFAPVHWVVAAGERVSYPSPRHDGSNPATGTR